MQKWFTAEWRSLLMVNYEIAPSTLQKYLPPGIELDTWNGKTLVSLVGLLWRRAKVLGFSFPFHRNFEQINFRFYVRRKTPSGWKHGLTFIKQIVPRSTIALVGRMLYQEHIISLATRNETGLDRIQYSWNFNGKWNSMQAKIVSDPHPMADGSEQQFVADRFWGYSPSSKEYKAEHPSWRISEVEDVFVDCDVANLYGPEFVPPLTGRYSSVFLSEGSSVSLYSGQSYSLLL